jgi:16S rRNA (guanine1207-N2)-methyltransferase
VADDTSSNETGSAETPADETEHYFSADPSVPFKRAPVRAEVWGHDLSLTSGSGVFAQGRLDIGTAILFRETDPPTTARRVLDLGCGYGVIGLAVAAAVPEALVTGVDVNERALLLAGENAAAMGVSDRYTAATPAQVPDDATYDEIWSNPPIRIGKPALHALLLQWLPRLAPGGRAVMVVGKNLGADSLQRWLGEQGWPTERVGGAKGFRVLEARRAVVDLEHGAT